MGSYWSNNQDLEEKVREAEERAKNAEERAANAEAKVRKMEQEASILRDRLPDTIRVKYQLLIYNGKPVEDHSEGTRIELIDSKLPSLGP